MTVKLSSHRRTDVLNRLDTMRTSVLNCAKQSQATSARFLFLERLILAYTQHVSAAISKRRNGGLMAWPFLRFFVFQPLPESEATVSKPKMPAKQGKPEFLAFRASAIERKAIELAALERDLSLSEFMRSACLAQARPGQQVSEAAHGR